MSAIYKMIKINREKLEKYLIVILLIGLILMIVWKFDIIGLLIQRKERAEIEKNRETWMKTAKENLKEDFLFMEGENHFFVKGRLVSECTEPDPNSHCPVSISEAKINGEKLFTDNFRFVTPGPDVSHYPVNEGINVLGFLDKNYNGNVSLEIKILDYVSNKELCGKPHGHDKTLCSLRWTKEIFLDEPVSAKNLSVKITDFDYFFLNEALRVFLKGEIESSEAPSVTLAAYKNFESRKSLLNKNTPELQDENGIYAFEFDGFFDVRDLEESYSILLLVTGENSFYAKEWVFKVGELVDTVTYD